MDHHEQHHQHHEKEREHKKHEKKMHESEEMSKPSTIHPLWFLVIGIILTLLVIIVWMRF